MLDQAVKGRILAQRDKELQAKKRDKALRAKKAERVSSNTLEALNLIIKGQTQSTGVDWASVLIHLDIARRFSEQLMNGHQS